MSRFDGFKTRLSSSMYDPLDTGVFLSFRPYGSEKAYYLKGLVFAELNEGRFHVPEGAGHLDYTGLPEPTLYRPDQEGLVQSILDAAWEKGMRPTGYRASSNAENKHLEDMRRIVFHQLSIPKE